MTGTINDIDNCGTIVVVWIDGTPVYFDHRPFRHLLEAEDCTPTDLIGRQASTDGDTLTFED